RRRHDRGLRLDRAPARALDAGLAMASTSRLVISNLSKRFGDLEALRSINVEVARGAFISLGGPPGCGKRTFLRIVAGLEPATSGEVLLDGRVVRRPGGDRGF